MFDHNPANKSVLICTFFLPQACLSEEEKDSRGILIALPEGSMSQMMQKFSKSQLNPT